MDKGNSRNLSKSLNGHSPQQFADLANTNIEKPAKIFRGKSDSS